MSNLIQLKLLGKFRLETAEGQNIALPLRKAEALLAYLATSAGQESSRENLSSLLWGAFEQQRARQSLRQVLLSLTKTSSEFGVSILRMVSKTVSLDLNTVSIDLIEFESLMAEQTPAAIGKALDLYQGEFVAGLAAHAAEYDNWLIVERARLHEIALNGCLYLLQTQESADKLGPAIQTATRALTLDPLREDIHRRLMRIYVRNGMRSSALAQYRHCCEVLERELDVAPDVETTELYRSVLAGGRNDGSGTNAAHETPGTGQINLIAAPTEEVDASTDPSIGSGLIGRTSEMEHLSSALVRVESTGCGLVQLIGETGVGKTELAREFGRKMLANGTPVFTVLANAAEQTLKFGLWTDLLAGMLPSRSDRRLRKLPGWARAQIERLVFGLGGSMGKTGETDGDLRPLYDAVLKFLFAISSDGPVLLILDDIGKTDENSLRLLSYLIRHGSRAPILFVSTARSVDYPPLAAVSQILTELQNDVRSEVLNLEPVSRADARHLVRSFGKSHNIELPFKDIWTLSEGNPGIIEAIYRESAGRDNENGRVGVPSSVRREVSETIASCSDGARQLVTAMGVAEGSVNCRILGSVVGLSDSETATALEELTATQIVEVDGEEVRFSRERYRAAICDELLPIRRTVLHAGLAEAIEKIHAGSLEPVLDIIAHHYRQAGQHNKALAAVIQNARLEAKRSARSRARALYRHVLDEAANLDRTEEVRGYEIDARVGLAALSETEGDMEKASEFLSRALVLAREIKNSKRISMVLLAQGRIECRSGLDGAIYENHRRGLAEAACAGSEHAWLPVEQMIARSHLMNSNYLGLVESVEKYRDHCSTYGPSTDEVDAALMLGVLHAIEGDFGQSFDECGRGIMVAESIGDEASLAACLQINGLTHTWHNDYEQALENFEKAIRIAEAHGDIIRLYGLRGFKGFALVSAERYELAVDELESAVTMAEKLQTKFLLPFFVAWLAEARLGTGTEEEAIRLSRKAYYLAADTNQAWARSVASRVLARSLANSGFRNLAMADRTIRAALADQKRMGLVFEIARSSVVYAKILRAQGELQRSSEVFGEAENIFTDMGMIVDSARAKTSSETLRPLLDLRP